MEESPRQEERAQAEEDRGGGGGVVWVVVGQLEGSSISHEGVKRPTNKKEAITVQCSSKTKYRNSLYGHA